MKLTFNINNVIENKMFDVLNITRKEKKKGNPGEDSLERAPLNNKCVLTAGKTANSPDWPAPLLP